MDFSFFDMLLEPLCILDEKSIVVYLNPAAAQLFELSHRKALNNKKFLDLLNFSPPYNELNQLTHIKEFIGYREVEYSVLSNKKNETERNSQENKSKKVQVALLPYSFNHKKYWILYFRDTTLENQLSEKYKAEMQQKEIYIGRLEQAQKELERYSENLELRVRERTSELEKLNVMMHTLLDSLDQGFFIFDHTGKCLPVYSKSCEILLTKKPGGIYFWDAIKADPENSIKIEKWIESLFAQSLPFKDLKNLGPDRVFHTYNRSLSLNYYPVQNAQAQLEGVVVVVTDKTELELAEKAAERERAYSKMILNVVRRKKEITRYIFDVQKLIEELNDAIADHYKFQMQKALRCLHTIKGGALTFAIYELAQCCHDAEQLLLEIQKDGLSKENLSILHSYFNKIRYEFQTFLKGNEILLGNEVIHGKRSVEIPLETISKFLNNLRTEEHLKPEISNFEKNIFYVPIAQFLEGFEETAQALALKLGKKLHPIVIHGGDTIIHREHYSELFTTLIHQLNNIVNHGIESPILRRFHHKEEFGQIVINVQIDDSDTNYGNSSLIIEITDDGQGIDPLKIREKLRSKGVATNLLTDQEVLQFIFKGNLSSRDQVTQISGRGIGMEAIMHTVTDLGGTVKIESSPLKGSTLTIRVPYITEQVKLTAA